MNHLRIAAIQPTIVLRAFEEIRSNSLSATVILSGAGAGREAKDLKLRERRWVPNSFLRNLRSFGVCAPQDDGRRSWESIFLQPLSEANVAPASLPAGATASSRRCSTNTSAGSDAGDRSRSLFVESPSPRRSGEKVPKADEGSLCDSKPKPLTPASRTLSPLRRGEGAQRAECHRENIGASRRSLAQDEAQIPGRP